MFRTTTLRLWWLLWVALLQGCAATGPKGVEMAATMGAIPEGYGRIVFFRANSVVGAAVQPEIRLDGQVVGQSKPGGFFYVDAAPGRHKASASTEASSEVELQVLAGQTQYVRSAISMGFVVGRVTLSVEGSFNAKGELMGLSYTGSQVPRIGAAPGGAAAGGANAAPAALVTRLAPLKRGDQVVYRVTDGYTGTPREAIHEVDRVDGERISFNRGGRLEHLNGTVLSVTTPVAGDMDACTPPGGWGPPADMSLGMRWNLRFRKPGGDAECGGDFDLDAQMVSDEVMATPLGNLKVQRIDYKGGGLRQTFAITFEAKAWYAPAIGRLVRFESEMSVRTGRSAAPNREKVELVEIRRE